MGTENWKTWLLPHLGMTRSWASALEPRSSAPTTSGSGAPLISELAVQNEAVESHSQEADMAQFGLFVTLKRP